MKRQRHGNRARFGGVSLAAALGALAMLALPALGIGDHGPRAAGTIESFDRESGLLVVDLAEGRKVAGLVVRRTKIRCARGHHRAHRRAAASQRGEGGDRLAPRDRTAPETDRPVSADRPEGGDRDGGDAVAPGSSDGPGKGADRAKHCIDALVPGAVVKRAEMVLAHGNAFYKKIGVLPAPATDAAE